MNITKENWGITRRKQEVFLYTLKNDFLEVEILNYGGVIRKISVPDKNGKYENVVLNLPSITDYEKRSPYFGAVVGRNAGRIKNGILKIEEKEYKLLQNSGPNSIHGGIYNFSHKIWNVREIVEEDKIALELTLKSPHLEEGFPGNIVVKVKYTLYKNELHLDYHVDTDRTTYVNLTNHTYFNLSGDFKKDIQDEYLKLNCNKFIAVDSETLPVEIRKVDRTPFDFRKEKMLKDALLSDDEQIKIVNKGLDHPFVIDKNETGAPIVLEDRENGRKLEVSTDQDAVVIYSGNYLYEVGNLNDDIVCKKYMGVCFETQNYADALNFIPEKAVITTPEKPYTQKTKYTFKVTK